jgi:hypothetical protein
VFKLQEERDALQAENARLRDVLQTIQVQLQDLETHPRDNLLFYIDRARLIARTALQVEPSNSPQDD